VTSIYLLSPGPGWIICYEHIIDSWDDLGDIFTDNFQGTYVHPGNLWELKGYWQKPGKSLWDYIRRFSQKCNELRSVADADVISMFWDGTMCHILVHELGCEPPKTTKELLDIATQHASGKEADGAAFILENAGTAASNGRAVPTKATIKSARKGAKGCKKGQKCKPCRIAIMANNSNDGEEADSSDEGFIAAAKHNFKR
jgi:hypothetical protein